METEKIRTLIQKAFAGPAWHGPAVMEALAEIAPETATYRTQAHTHSVAELVVHMTAWRNFVIRKLKGEEFEMTEEFNFPAPGGWQHDLSALMTSQQELLQSLDNFPEGRLGEIVPGRSYDYYTLLHGIIQHDIYHTGQIMLLKKSAETVWSSTR